MDKCSWRIYFVRGKIADVPSHLDEEGQAEHPVPGNSVSVIEYYIAQQGRMRN
jgi:hypothetical protein